MSGPSVSSWHHTSDSSDKGSSASTSGCGSSSNSNGRSNSSSYSNSNGSSNVDISISSNINSSRGSSSGSRRRSINLSLTDAEFSPSSSGRGFATGESTSRWFGTSHGVVTLTLGCLALTLTLALFHTQHPYSLSPLLTHLSRGTSPLNLFSSLRTTKPSSSAHLPSKQTTQLLTTQQHIEQQHTNQEHTTQPLGNDPRAALTRALHEEGASAPLPQCSGTEGPCAAKASGNPGLSHSLSPHKEGKSRKGQLTAAPGPEIASWRPRKRDKGSFFARLASGTPQAHPALVPQAGGNGSGEVGSDYDSCSTVRLAPPGKQCELAGVLCKSLSGDTLVDYMSLHYCTFGGNPWVSAPLYTLGLLLAFYLLADTAESFFCPTVTILSDMLHLAPNTAGVTLLALGNGAPDLSGAIASFTKGDPHIAMGAILSAGTFVTSFVVGAVALFVAPFPVEAAPFIRDAAMYAVAVVLVLCLYCSKEVHLWHAVCMVGYYVVFVAVVVILDWRDWKKVHPQSVHEFPTSTSTENENENENHAPSPPISGREPGRRSEPGRERAADRSGAVEQTAEEAGEGHTGLAKSRSSAPPDLESAGMAIDGRPQSNHSRGGGGRESGSDGDRHQLARISSGIPNRGEPYSPAGGRSFHPGGGSVSGTLGAPSLPRATSLSLYQGLLASSSSVEHSDRQCQSGRQLLGAASNAVDTVRFGIHWVFDPLRWATIPSVEQPHPPHHTLYTLLNIALCPLLLLWSLASSLNLSFWKGTVPIPISLPTSWGGATTLFLPVWAFPYSLGVAVGLVCWARSRRGAPSEPGTPAGAPRAGSPAGIPQSKGAADVVVTAQPKTGGTPQGAAKRLDRVTLDTAPAPARGIVTPQGMAPPRLVVPPRGSATPQGRKVPPHLLMPPRPAMTPQGLRALPRIMTPHSSRAPPNLVNPRNTVTPRRAVTPQLIATPPHSIVTPSQSIVPSNSIVTPHGVVIQGEEPEHSGVPEGWVVFASFAMSIIWIGAFARELLGLLSSLGAILGASDAILGVTILAWGNSVGDLVTNITVALAGQPMMAVASCFAGPLFNLMLGLGIPLAIKTGWQYPVPWTFHRDPQLLMVFPFLLVGVLGSLVVVPYSGFKVNRTWGYFLLGLYVSFIVVSLCVELFVVP